MYIAIYKFLNIKRAFQDLGSYGVFIIHELIRAHFMNRV